MLNVQCEQWFILVVCILLPVMRNVFVVCDDDDFCFILSSYFCFCQKHLVNHVAVQFISNAKHSIHLDAENMVVS